MVIFKTNLQTLLGTEIGNLIPPTDIDSVTYDVIRARCTSQEEINLLESCYGQEATPSSSLLCDKNGSQTDSKTERKYVLLGDHR